MTGRWPGWLIPAFAAAALLGGLLLRQSNQDAGNLVWTVGLVLTGFPVVLRTVLGLLRGRFAADLVASLAILTSIFLATPLPGLIVVLMQTGGELLERHAEGRASRAVAELEAAAPTIGHRLKDGQVEDLPVQEIEPGDRLLVRPGEILPCDGLVMEGQSTVDASRLTGEAVPVEARPGIRLLSGTINGQGPLVLTALARAQDSQYARIVELVRTAQASKSPFQRMADRYAIWFTPLTLVTCGVAFALSQDWSRVLAVLVVATPCPLILAAPVAVIGGINRGARHGIIFRTGGALESLAEVTAVAFDKTGTLTLGRPQVQEVWPLDHWTADEVLRLAGALEEQSSHPLARSVVSAALGAHSALPVAREVKETPGRGILGQVEGRAVAVGGSGWMESLYPDTAPTFASHRGKQGLSALVAIDGRAAGVIAFEDRIRPGVKEFVGELRSLGLGPLILLSGDNDANTQAAGRDLALDRAEGDMLARDKAERVKQLMNDGHRVVMLGDGTNDAPALSTATVGVALALGGSGISSSAADVVLLADEPADLATAIQVSRDTMRICRQSVWAGLGLSLLAMAFAAGGAIRPTIGALIQEGIDVAVIVNALRAGRAGMISSRPGRADAPLSSARTVPAIQ